MAMFAILMVVYLICVIVHVLTMALAGWLVGAEIIEINLFVGPRILKAQPGCIAFYIRLIPLGGSVKFTEDFQNLHPLKRAFVASSGCLVLLALAAVPFGISGGIAKLLNGFPQVIYGVLAPRTLGPELLHALYEFLTVNSLIASLGLLAAKLAAFNLLPIPALNGGDILLAMLDWIKPIPIQIKERLMQIGLFFLLSIIIGWIVAFGYSLSRL